ncbi:MAG: hypothetical protein H7263_07970, partial [Candidatus Sericytochromatia bacterium]|nr:hypothetical protein [Candidatus Sericytochromatia bacterium]
MKNIKRIQNQLNYLSEYAKKLSKKDSSIDELKENSDLVSSNEIIESDNSSYTEENFKLTKNDTTRI